MCAVIVSGELDLTEVDVLIFTESGTAEETG